MGGQAPSAPGKVNVGTYNGKDYSTNYLGGVTDSNGQTVAADPYSSGVGVANGKAPIGQVDPFGTAIGGAISHGSDMSHGGGGAPAAGGAIPSLGDVAASPSPFQTWLDPKNPNGLSTGATFDPSTLSSDFLGKLGAEGGGKVDASALGALQGYAVDPKTGQLNANASPWLDLQNQNIDLRTGQNRSQASLDAQSASDSAMSNAAMHGGITGGGAARISGLGAMAGAAGQQNASLQGSEAKNSAAINDWQNKLGVASALPGMQESLANYNSGNAKFNADTENAGKEFNIGNLIGGMQTGNNNLLQQYAQTIAGKSGTDMANALAHTGKKK